MATRRSLYLQFTVLFILVFVSSAFSHHQKEDPEFQRCRSRCQQQHQHDPSRLRHCEQQCEERHQEREKERSCGCRGHEEAQMDPIGLREPEEQCKRDCHLHKGLRRECEKRCEDKYGGKKYWEDDEQRGREEEEEVVVRRREPRELLESCRRECRQQHGDQGEMWFCERQCEERYHAKKGVGERENAEEEEEESTEEEEEVGNPFTFEKHRLRERVRTEDGGVRVTPRFGHQSELFRGIDSYRLAILEAEPNSFVMPNHYDADAVFFVGRGKGAIALLLQEKKETVNIERGDIIRVPAGTTFFMINKDNSQKLCIAILFRTISTPGKYKAYFAAGGVNPESFFRSFSNEVLEAAFNTGREKLKRMLGQQRRGSIFRISREQVQGMTKHASSSEEGGHWPFHHGDESIKPYNLFRHRPSHSNDRGELFEACADDYYQLRELDIAVTFVNISSGSMQAPYYNSRATEICLAVDGSGYFEMACPHLGSKQRQGRRGGEEEQEEKRERRQEGRGEEREEEQEQVGPESYRAVRSRLSHGTIFVVLAGHPLVIVASRNQNLQIVCFKVNSRNSEQFFLAGKNSILKKMGKEEMEVAFNMPAPEVKEILDAARDSYFLEGPEERREGGVGRGGRHHALESILDFAVGLY